MQRIIDMDGRQVWPKPKRIRDHRGRFSIRSYLRYQWSRFLAFTWKWTKRAAFAAVFLALLSAVYLIGQAQAKEITAINVIAPAAPVRVAPVMERIAKAESEGKQYGPSGQVLVHANNNGTVDIGKYQINSVWFSLATKLGYDLTKEKDNEAFALYLYEQYGTSPWESSAARWKK